MLKIRGQKILALFFLCLGGVVLSSTFRDAGTDFILPDELAPMTYPRYLIYFWLVLSALYFFATGPATSFANLHSSAPGLCRVTASIAAYIILFRNVGLPLSTFIFLLLFFYVMNYRDPKRALPFAVLGAFLTWFAFEKILGVPMPRPFWV